jgi:hypothetical protein
MKNGFLIVFFGLTAVAITVSWLIYREVHEPSYKGKTLSDWLVCYEQANRHFPRSHESDEAIRHFGSSALPYLLTWLQYESPRWLDKPLAALDNCPVPFHGAATNVSGVFRSFQQRRDRRYGVSIWAFGLLGPDAHSASPQLAALAVGRRPVIARRAVRVLQDMGTNGFSAIPLLIRAWQSKDPVVAPKAEFALACLQLQSDLEIPALKSYLQDLQAPKWMASRYEPRTNVFVLDTQAAARLAMTNATKSENGRWLLP